MTVSGTKISLHHIGGRFGNGGFPVIPEFEQDMVRVYYDADKDCIDQIREKMKGSSSEVHVLPYCIGGADGQGTLHVNYDTTSSSLYPLNPEYAPFYFFSYNHDFVAADSLRTMEERKIDIVSLDRLYGSDRISVPPPDFLSMDVQGAEYPVLEGGRKVLKQNVLGLVIETGLHPLYEGQRIFDDVRRLLSDSGFYFVRFLNFHDYAPYRAPIGRRGEGFNILADALFLRRTDDIENSFSDDALRYAMYRKLAFISIVYGQFEYGLACLNSASGLAAKGSGQLQGLRYHEFLVEINKSSESMPEKYPPAFSEKYTYELSKRRFETKGSAAASLRERLWLRFVYPNIYRIAGLYRFLFDKLWAPFASLLFPNSPVERTLRKYGLSAQAALIKKKRVVQYMFSR